MRSALGTLSFSLVLAGCGHLYQLPPPVGFAVVEDDWRSTRMKASDNVGLSMLVFDNVDGGTLEYWSTDLVTKLGRRHYALTNQEPVSSKNRVSGTRFDFEYTPPGGNEAKFLVVLVFVTDDYRYVVQLAGARQASSRYSAQIPQIVEKLELRGCKLASKTCRGAQPGQLADLAPGQDSGSGAAPAPG